MAKSAKVDGDARGKMADPSFITATELAAHYEMWGDSFEGGKFVNKADIRPKQSLQRRELGKEGMRIARMLRLICDGEAFPVKKLANIQYYGRGKDEGGILERLKESLRSCC